LLLIIGLIGVAVAALVPSAVSSAFLGRLSLPDVSLSGNFFNRGDLYRTSWGLVGKMPAFGYGANMNTVFGQSWGGLIIWPHSLYMTTLLTAGFVGLPVLAWLLFGLVAMPVRCALHRRVGGAELRALGSILAVVIVCWVVNEVKIEFLRQVFYVNLMAFLFGLVSSLFWLSRHSDHGQHRVARRDGSSAEAPRGG